jgi:hypothetical protein
MSSHGGAVAAALPYLGSIFPVVMLQSTRLRPATHRPQRRYVSRGRELVGSEGAVSRMLAGSLRIVGSDSASRHDPNSIGMDPARCCR